MLHMCLCVSTLITRPNVSCGHPATVIFQLLGEFPSFILSWLDILIHLCLVSACSRAMTATLDKTSDSLFHDFILKNFGMTPFINTFPDFMAGGAVMITALFIAAGMEESKTLRRWLNIATGSALGFITIVGISRANPETLKAQPFLLDGSNGVVLSACVLSLVFVGGVQMCHSARTSSQPHRLVPLANGMSQLALTLTLLMIAVILPMLAQLSPTGLLPEVPMLQAFENEVGRGWTRLIIAVLTIISLCFSLLELSLPLHRMVQQLVSEGLLFRWLGVKFYRTSTPFLGSVILGSLTATLATLGDVSWLLLTGAGGKIAFDLTICTSALLVHYGVGLPQCSSTLEAAEENNLNSGTGGLAAAGSKASGRRRRLQRRRRKRHKVDLRTISSSIANTMGNDLSGNVGSPTATTSASHDQDHPQSSLSLYQIASPIDPEASSAAIPKDKPKGPRVVDAAEKVRTSYFNKGLAKVRMIFGHHQILRTSEEESKETADTASMTLPTASNGHGQSLNEESETESSPSGYGTETSDSSENSSGDADTDIDTIVNEYRDEASLPTHMREYPKTNKNKPSKATANIVIMATGVLLMSFILQFIILDSVKSSTMINAVILNLGISVAVFVLLLVISKQPVDKERGRTDFTFIMPLAPWSHALAMFLNLSLMARVLHSAALELFLWILLGVLIYGLYGINHSLASPEKRSHQRMRPRERPNTLMLSPVQISSIPTDIGSTASAANYATPTFDLSSNERRSIIKNKKTRMPRNENKE